MEQLQESHVEPQEVLENSMDLMSEKFEAIITSLSIFKSQILSIQQQLRNVEKSLKKEFKQLKKEADKNKNKGNKKPSGFATPSKVTNELCEFMNAENGSEIARTVVTKTLIEYIKKNKLENNDNNQIIHPDQKLQTLLGINENDKLTYFTLQKHMNKHFIKKVKQSAESVN
jgi:chromatin remodeling complex protein RSC6